MLFSKITKYDKYIHKGGYHGSDGELWNRIDLRMILHAAQQRVQRTAFGFLAIGIVVGIVFEFAVMVLVNGCR